MPDDIILEINRLYKKSKEEGLSPKEEILQKELRRQYIEKFKSGFKRQLENIDVKYENGNTVPLTAFKKDQKTID